MFDFWFWKCFFLGHTICIFSQNCNNFVVSLIGCSLAHVTCKTANPTYTGHELKYQLEFSDASAILIGSNLLSTLEDALKLCKEENKSPQIKEIFVLESSEDVQNIPTLLHGIPVYLFETLLKQPDGPFLEPESLLDPKTDTWIRPFSSGTTGLPKGVELTHYNMLSNVYQFAQYKNLFNFSQNSTMIGVLPLYHLYGLYIYAICCPMRGGNVVLQPEFKPVSFLMAIQKHRATHVYIVPPLALFISKDPRVKDYDITNVEVSKLWEGQVRLSLKIIKENALLLLICYEKQTRVAGLCATNTEWSADDINL